MTEENKLSEITKIEEQKRNAIKKYEVDTKNKNANMDESEVTNVNNNDIVVLRDANGNFIANYIQRKNGSFSRMDIKD